MFEYMAGGKPVVSTGFEEIRQYPEVLIGETHDDFIAKVDQALQLSGDLVFLERARGLVAANTWKDRAERILAVLNRRCGRPASQPASAASVAAGPVTRS
jgi:hypothetical protein